MPKWHWAHCLCKPHGQGPQMPKGTGTHWSCEWTNVRKKVEGPLWGVAQQSHYHRGWAQEPQHPSAAGTGVCSRLAAAGGEAVMSTMLLDWLVWRIGCHCLLPVLPAMVARKGRTCAARSVHM